MKKRAVSIILAVGMLSVLTACGGQQASTGGTTEAAPGGTSGAAVSENAESEAAGESGATAESASDDASVTGMSGQASPADSAAAAGEIKLASHSVGDLTLLEPEADMEEIDSGEAEEMDRVIRAYEPVDSSLLVNRAEHFYYYETLDAEEQELYDAMLMVAQNPQADGSSYLVPVTVQANPESEEFRTQYFEAYYSMLYDHPELYWLYNQTEVTLNGYIYDMGDSYMVYLFLEEPFENYTEQMTAFNDAAEELLAQIDTSQSEYDIAREVHDRLIDQVTYDMPVCENGLDSYSDLAHTAYGCFVADSEGNDNYAVCDGYSLAYEYILQQLGIESTVILGDAGDTEDNVGGHAWNMAKLDGKWYEIDVTWDDDDGQYAHYADDEEIDYRIREALNDTDYLDRLNHFLYAISSEKIRNYTPGEDLYYTSSDGSNFTIVGDSVHIRESEMDAAEANAYYSQLMQAAPIAE